MKIFEMVTELWGIQEFLEKKNEKKNEKNRRDNTLNLNTGKQLFLRTTHHLDLIHIPITFHEDIPNGY